MNMRSSRGSLLWLLASCAVLCGLSVAPCTGSEYFSSVSGMENLLRTEVVLLSELKQYLDEVTEHVNTLSSEVDAIQREHLEASKDLEGYLNNPVNAYRLIKRLLSDWKMFEDTVRSETSTKLFLDVMAMHREKLDFPKEDDLVGSTVALVRLQETYQLDVAQVASGILNGVKYGSSMSWQDCFLLGHHLYQLRDFNHTIPWLKQSMKLLTSQEYHDDPMALEFMEAVAAYHQEMGDFETALSLVDRVIAVDPQRENNYEVKHYLEKMLASGERTGLMHQTALPPGDYHLTNEYKLYKKVCRGEVAATPTQQRPLRCRLHTNGVAYRLLQPFRLEELHLDPYVVQFHDVIADSQIEAVKRLAKPRMERSKVRTVDGSDATTSNIRTSKSAWFRYGRHPAMLEMLRHVADLSGLNTTFAEELQVANYGIGGHYEPHWDFFTEENSYSEVDGNRISTAIYYLSDVEEGGGTAFPFLGLVVKPKKGSVLFWYNLHRSEERDYRTKHAACPVLKGSKWIGNIWLRVRNQEFARPCGLRPEGQVSLMYKDHD